jgi:hypothetical protein
MCESSIVSQDFSEEEGGGEKLARAKALHGGIPLRPRQSTRVWLHPILPLCQLTECDASYGHIRIDYDLLYLVCYSYSTRRYQIYLDIQ